MRYQFDWKGFSASMVGMVLGIGLLFLIIPTLVHAFNIPSAEESRRHARATVQVEIANEVPLLEKVATEEIIKTSLEGYTFTNFYVEKYHMESLHIVAEELRRKGYWVKVQPAIMTGQLLMCIDWEGLP
ncbi:MAG: hypothetical protein ACREBR_04840 [bacterium]